MPSIATLPGLSQDYISQFFLGDIVVLKSNPEERGVIQRAWADEEDEATCSPDPLDRPLLLGEVGLRFGKEGVRKIMPESDLLLLSRNIFPGDIVKRTLSSSQAAIVLSTKTEVLLEKSFDAEKIEGWIPMEKLTSAARFRPGDKVIKDEWVGVVTMIAQVGYVINEKSGRVYYPCDTMGAFDVGTRVSDIMAGLHRENVAMHIEPWAQPEIDYVSATAQHQVMVSWQAINQKIPDSEQSRYPPPKAWYSGGGMKQLVRISKEMDRNGLLGLSYVFKDVEDYERYGIERRPAENTIGETTAMRIYETRTMARLQWQDGHITEELSTDVVPHDRLDEHESWPGQHVIRTDDDGKKQTAVVQRYDSVQRLVDIRYTDTSTVETVSVLELDHSSEEHHEYGAALGEHVFLCNNNGQPTPYVPSIGVSPDYSADPRDFLVESMAAGLDAALNDAEWAGVRLEPNDIDWFGEVVTLEKDGRVGVRLSNGKTVMVELKNVLLLNSGIEDTAMGLAGMDAEDDYGDEDESMGFPPFPFPGPHHMPNPGAMFADFLNQMDRQSKSNFPRDVKSDASWETLSDEDEDEDEDMMSDYPLVDLSEASRVPTPQPDSVDHTILVDLAPVFQIEHAETDSVADDADQVDNSIEMAPSSPPTQRSRSPTPPKSTLQPTYTDSNSHAGPSSAPRDTAWQAFDVLDSAPSEHRFFGEAPASSSRARMKKLNAEHKALRTSLPDNILVRTYEDRLDLMRVLIIGPEGTPYAGAPFVFDVFLRETYPNEPPLVHFHSQTNGKGRCNPNLYEEGKVCLSILGTWMGDASESWHAERSSLLQVFVSISGLVLVRNPYHCEPAYAKLEGTRDGRINSRLYSEKAYVLSRGFIKQALAWPQAGLENEIRHYYLTKGHLEEVIDHARVLMEKEAPRDEDEAEERWDADFIGSLTAGAKLSLKRVFAGLEQTWLDYQATTKSETPFIAPS